MANKKVLVVGGTGPTGPVIVEGLAERGFDVTILHRGFHEVEFKYPVEHIHGEPHFAEEFRAALGDNTYDVIVAMYGRLRIVAEACLGKTERFIGVGAGVPDDQILPVYDVGARTEEGDNSIQQRVAQAREEVMDYHRAGRYNVTYFGYPSVYGPRQPGPLEWSVMRRILDGRKKFMLLDGGLHIRHFPYVENCAQPILLAVDKPEESAGQFYAATEEAMPTDRYRVQTIADIMGVEIETYSFPHEMGVPGWWWGNGDFTFAKEGRAPRMNHTNVSVEKLKRELGYKDVVDPYEAHKRSVEWLLENKPTPGGEDEQIMGDPFDYVAEDAYFEAFERFAKELDAIPFAGYSTVHRYQHPKEPWQKGVTAQVDRSKTSRGQRS